MMEDTCLHTRAFKLQRRRSVMGWIRERAALAQHFWNWITFHTSCQPCWKRFSNIFFVGGI